MCHPFSIFYLSFILSHLSTFLVYIQFVGYLDIDPTQCHPNYTADIREGVAVEYVSCEPSEGMKELFPEEYGVDDDSFEEEETEQA